MVQLSQLYVTTGKKAEQQRVDVFKMWCWRRLLNVPCTARRLNQSILKEINPEYSLEDWCWSWSSNTLANQHTGKDPDASKDWRQKRVTEDELPGITDAMDMNWRKLWEMVRDREAWHAAFHGVHEEWDTTWWLSKNNKHLTICSISCFVWKQCLLLLRQC